MTIKFDCSADLLSASLMQTGSLRYLSRSVEKESEQQQSNDQTDEHRKKEEKS